MKFLIKRRVFTEGQDSKSGGKIDVWLRLLSCWALDKGEAEAEESLFFSSELLEEKQMGEQGALCRLSE